MKIYSTNKITLFLIKIINNHKRTLISRKLVQNLVTEKRVREKKKVWYRGKVVKLKKLIKLIAKV